MPRSPRSLLLRTVLSHVCLIADLLEEASFVLEISWILDHLAVVTSALRTNSGCAIGIPGQDPSISSLFYFFYTTRLALIERMRGGKALAYGAAICASWTQVVDAVALDIADTSMFKHPLLVKPLLTNHSLNQKCSGDSGIRNDEILHRKQYWRQPWQSASAILLVGSRRLLWNNG